MAKDQWEEESIERFREFLSRERGVTFGVSGRDVVVDPTTNENFDYQLTSNTGNQIAVEIFRLVESGDDLASDKVWSQVVALLKEELIRTGVTGYVIALPRKIGIPLREVKTYAEKAATTITAAIRNNIEAEKFTTGGITFRRIEQYETVSFSWGGEARYVNPHGTAGGIFQKKLDKKNKQLGVSNHERILLVTNWTFFIDAPDIIRALSAIDFEQYPNVDKIFFETRNHRFSQVYDRKTYTAILNKQIKDADETDLLLRYLKHQLANKKKDAYEFVKAVTEEAGSIDWLSNKEARENLVLYAQGLAEEGQIDEAHWVIRQLHNDPDPDPAGQNTPDDPSGQYNHHLRILNGEEDCGITTVRGHLCWLIARVIVQNKPELYEELIDILDRYLSEENLYIRTQALIPLSELTARIRATKNQDGTPFEWSQSGRDRVRVLAFRTLTQNAQYARVLQILFHVFEHMRGLTESEAKTVLNTFLATQADYILHDVAVLVIYFALFREHDFKEDPPFEARDFVELLKQQISLGKPSMRSSLAWHFWNCLKNKHLTPEEVKEYLLMFWEQPYDQNLASMFDLIFDELAELSPPDACEVFEQMIERLKELGESNREALRDVWIHTTGELMGCLAQFPARLVRIVNMLVDVWKNGGAVYNLVEVLESYRHIEAPGKDLVKTELMRLYREIKDLKPEFPEIDWSR